MRICATANMLSIIKCLFVLNVMFFIKDGATIVAKELL